MQNGGAKRTGNERQVDMLCYLSEMLDELLMNKQMVVSDSPARAARAQPLSRAQVRLPHRLRYPVASALAHKP